MSMSKLEKSLVNRKGHSQGVARQAIKLLQKVPARSDQTFLDVGTGNGTVPIAVAQTFGLNVTGVDIDSQQISLARKAAQDIPGVHFETLDGRSLPFEDSHFDIVFSNKVTHHIPDWQNALAEMARVLKPGGCLIYSDLVLPRLLAKMGEAVAGNKVGFPNRPAIEAFAKQNKLVAEWKVTNTLHFTAIFRKE